MPTTRLTRTSRRLTKDVDRLAKHIRREDRLPWRRPSGRGVRARVHGAVRLLTDVRSSADGRVRRDRLAGSVARMQALHRSVMRHPDGGAVRSRGPDSSSRRRARRCRCRRRPHARGTEQIEAAAGSSPGQSTVDGLVRRAAVVEQLARVAAASGWWPGAMLRRPVLTSRLRAMTKIQPAKSSVVPLNSAIRRAAVIHASSAMSSASTRRVQHRLAPQPTERVRPPTRLQLPPGDRIAELRGRDDGVVGARRASHHVCTVPIGSRFSNRARRGRRCRRRSDPENPVTP